MECSYINFIFIVITIFLIIILKNIPFTSHIKYIYKWFPINTTIIAIPIIPIAFTSHIKQIYIIVFLSMQQAFQ